MIVIYKPFKTGDMVELEGKIGHVEFVHLFNTEICTLEGLKLIIPNSNIWTNKIVNYTSSPERRIDLIFSISYDDNIETAEKIVEKVLQRYSDVILKKPKGFFVGVNSWGESSIDLLARFWVLNENYLKIQFKLKKDVKIEFDKANITIPYPHRTVYNNMVEKKAK